MRKSVKRDNTEDENGFIWEPDFEDSVTHLADLQAILENLEENKPTKKNQLAPWVAKINEITRIYNKIYGTKVLNYYNEKGEPGTYTKYPEEVRQENIQRHMGDKGA